MIDRRIIEDNLPPSRVPAPTRVAHYTRIGTLCKFVSRTPVGWSSAWASPVQFLNDRMELSLGLEVLSLVGNAPPRSSRRVLDILEDLTNSFGRLESDAFQMSFSGNPDELGQWRGYASNGMGCAVETEVSALHAVSDVGGWVIYDPKRQRRFARRVLTSLRGVATNDLMIERVLVAAASFMKHNGFLPEREYRVLRFPDVADVEFREAGDRLVPYVDLLKGKAPLPVQRVIIGPGWQLSRLPIAEMSRQPVVLGVQRLLAARGLAATGIEPSSIPYDPR